MPIIQDMFITDDILQEMKRWATGASFLVLSASIIWTVLPTTIHWIPAIAIVASQLWLSVVVAMRCYPSLTLPDHETVLSERDRRAMHGNESDQGYRVDAGN